MVAYDVVTHELAWNLQKLPNINEDEKPLSVMLVLTYVCHLFFKPGVHQPAAGVLLVSRNSSCLQSVCVCVCV